MPRIDDKIQNMSKLPFIEEQGSKSERASSDNYNNCGARTLIINNNVVLMP